MSKIHYYLNRTIEYEKNDKIDKKLLDIPAVKSVELTEDELYQILIDTDSFTKTQVSLEEKIRKVLDNEK